MTQTAKIIEFSKCHKLSGETMYGIPVEAFSDPVLKELWMKEVSKVVKNFNESLGKMDINIL